MMLCDLNEIKIRVERQYKDCHGYSGNKKAIYREAIIAVRSILHSAKAIDAVPVVRCRECKHLNVVNRKELYAHCPKTNTVFLPFELDTREHFCSLGERKEGADNG